MAPAYASESRGSDSTIRMSGEIDVEGRDDLAEILESFVGAHHRIVLDMAGVTAFDEAALRVIVEAAQWAADERGSLVIRNPSPVVRRLLEAEPRLGLLEGGPGDASSRA
ncbi:MAG TPA: STAS domain-containing protein [Acidimicrobiia bacterium]|jgi:anti-anti-sigma factor|nr:STAS domain-containing protein [Acidimicrobiia bacterium]